MDDRNDYSKLLINEPTEHKFHELKTYSNYFCAICYGGKNFEVRKNDRNYQKGDYLILRNYDPLKKEYNYGFILAEITYVLQGGQFGIDPEYVILALKILKTEY